MKTKIILGTFMLLTFWSNAQTTDPALKEVKKIIEASNKTFSDFTNKNDGSILARYTEDACLFPPNAEPKCGGQQIDSFFRGGPQVHVKFTIQHLYGDAKSAVTEESFYEMTDMSGKKLDDGKVIVIWKKTKDGWKMHRDMFSSNHPAKQS
ncbi:hypothetical protein [Flavobacterium sp. TR2]|uniref:YybH family protein n=1 Tax=Flavobacterium sp. TR2 TaxID=2977321 RepID=UPI0021B1314F|nr:hypothetical protein [Flavobacterium sp. TR2]UWY26916.1 hypothetical protein N4T20_14425 [Flavobacterium sp. TR2]